VGEREREAVEVFLEAAAELNLAERNSVHWADDAALAAR
jgi:hypothetical protein